MFFFLTAIKALQISTAVYLRLYHVKQKLFEAKFYSYTEMNTYVRFHTLKYIPVMNKQCSDPHSKLIIFSFVAIGAGM